MDPTHRELDGRRALVTGGSRGIGAAVARALAERGASVVVSARGREGAEAEAAGLRERGARAWAVACDVAEPDQVEALAAAATRRMGGVDILVNNAGIAGSSPLARTSFEEWQRMLAVNATGTFLVTRALVPAMVARGWGRVVNVASIAGRVGAPYISAYAASKHAVVGFTRAVAAEVAAEGVTVNAVCPGYVDTEMTSESVVRIVEKTGLTAGEARHHLERTSPQGRLMEPAEVAFLVACLCADGARGINGQAIVLDGGAVQG